MLNPTFFIAQIKLRVFIANQVNCSDQKFLMVDINNTQCMTRRPCESKEISTTHNPTVCLVRKFICMLIRLNSAFLYKKLNVCMQSTTEACNLAM